MKVLPFSRLLVLGSLLFFFLSSIERKPAVYLTKKNICPSLGDLKPWQIPLDSTYFDYWKGERITYLRGQAGEDLRLSEKHLRFARLISNSQEKSNFHQVYEKVCGEKPAFSKSMVAAQRENWEALHQKRKIFRDRKRFEKNLAERNYSKEIVQKKVQIIQTELEQVEPIRFQVIGKVLAEKGKDLVLFGSSIPQKSTRLQVSGFVYNGLILLKNHRKADIQSPPDYAAKHVQAVELEFVKRISSKNETGENLPIYVFQHSKKDAREKKIIHLRKALKENLDLLASME